MVYTEDHQTCTLSTNRNNAVLNGTAIYLLIISHRQAQNRKRKTYSNSPTNILSTDIKTNEIEQLGGPHIALNYDYPLNPSGRRVGLRKRL